MYCVLHLADGRISSSGPPAPASGLPSFQVLDEIKCGWVTGGSKTSSRAPYPGFSILMGTRPGQSWTGATHVCFGVVKSGVASLEMDVLTKLSGLSLPFRHFRAHAPQRVTAFGLSYPHGRATL